jgi:hypothetical protein
MTEAERNLFNATYLKNTEYVKDIIGAASKITKPITHELDSCIESVLHACGREHGLALSYEELETLAIKIPALCLYIQSKLNDYSLRCEVEELLTNALVIDTLADLQGERGDAREKMKRAEAMQLNSRIVEALDRQVCANLKDTIVRADKVYEGIKKVLDAKMRENEYNRKSQKYTA